MTHAGPGATDDQHDARSPGDEPFAVHQLHVLQVEALARLGLEQDHRVLAGGLEALGVGVRKRRHHDAHADLVAGASAQSRQRAGREAVQQLAHRRQQALLLDANGRVAEARRELERVDAVRVNDAVDVDVADVALARERGLHPAQRLVENLVRLAPEHRRAHLPGRGTDVAGKQLLVLEIDADRVHELAPVEERTGRDLDPEHAPLELEALHLVGPGALVVLQHLDDVAAVLLLADE